jgi:hypothetical protein
MAPYNQESPVSRSWDSGLCNIGLGLASPVKSGMGTAGSYKRIHWPGTQQQRRCVLPTLGKILRPVWPKSSAVIEREKKRSILAAFSKNYTYFCTFELICIIPFGHFSEIPYKLVPA